MKKIKEKQNFHDNGENCQRESCKKMEIRSEEGWGVTTCTGSCRRKGGRGVKREHNLAERRESGEPVQVEGGGGGGGGELE